MPDGAIKAHQEGYGAEKPQGKGKEARAEANDKEHDGGQGDEGNESEEAAEATDADDQEKEEKGGDEAVEKESDGKGESNKTRHWI